MKIPNRDRTVLKHMARYITDDVYVFFGSSYDEAQRLIELREQGHRVSVKEIKQALKEAREEAKVKAEYFIANLRKECLKEINRF